MSKTRKLHYCGCHSLRVIKWANKEESNATNVKIVGCYLTCNNPSTSHRNRFVWFREWIIGKQTFFQLSITSSYSERSLKHYFYAYLRDYPTWKIHSSEKVDLLIDGTFFNNKVCLVLYRDRQH